MTKCSRCWPRNVLVDHYHYHYSATPACLCILSYSGQANTLRPEHCQVELNVQGPSTSIHRYDHYSGLQGPQTVTGNCWTLPNLFLPLPHLAPFFSSFPVTRWHKLTMRLCHECLKRRPHAIQVGVWEYLPCPMERRQEVYNTD